MDSERDPELEALAARIVRGQRVLDRIGRDDPKWAAGFRMWSGWLAEYERRYLKLHRAWRALAEKEATTNA